MTVDADRDRESTEDPALVEDIHADDTDSKTNSTSITLTSTASPVSTRSPIGGSSDDHDHSDHHHPSPKLQGASVVALPAQEKGPGRQQGTGLQKNEGDDGRHDAHLKETTKVNMHEQQHVLIHDWLMALLICFAILLLVLLLAVIIMCSRMSFTVTKTKVIDDYNVDDGKSDFDYYNTYPVREIKY